MLWKKVHSLSLCEKKNIGVKNCLYGGTNEKATD